MGGIGLKSRQLYQRQSLHSHYSCWVTVIVLVVMFVLLRVWLLLVHVTGLLSVMQISRKELLHLQSPKCQPTFIFVWYITLLWFSLSFRLELCLHFPFISYYLAEFLQLQESWATTIMSLFISHDSGDLLSSARWFVICFIQLVTDENLVEIIKNTSSLTYLAMFAGCQLRPLLGLLPEHLHTIIFI